jgi:hypothetical protein
MPEIADEETIPVQPGDPVKGWQKPHHSERHGDRTLPIK